MRDHSPTVYEDFNGLFARGTDDACPPDHFIDCNNIDFTQSAFKTRDGLDIYQATRNPLRMYEYNATLLGLEGLLLLNTSGEIHHVISGIDFLVMTIGGMTDFAIQEFDGRVYISPSTFNGPGGMTGQYLWVYFGDQATPARVAAGIPPVDADGLLHTANSATVGFVDAGIHIFGVVYETDTGYLTSIGPNTLPTLNATGGFAVDFTNIPISPNSYVKKRHLVATLAIDPTLYDGNTRGHNFFFIPEGVIPDNTTTSKTLSFFDSELIDDASHLFDNYSRIPAGGGLTLYHNRLLSWDSDVGIAVVIVSAPGEPEAFSQVDGLIELPAQGEGITACFVYRDVLYICKINATTGTFDNGDVPSSWQQSVIDQGIGCAKHGVAIVGEAGFLNIEFVIVINYSGIFIFNGIYQRPELSWKIKDLWLTFNQVTIALLSEIYNDVLHQKIFINIPYLNMIIMGDYSNALDYKDIRWAKWTFNVAPTTMALIGKTNTLLIGSSTSLSAPITIPVPDSPSNLMFTVTN